MAETTYWCNQQGMYRHGAQMCTTACMQVGMAVLCGQLDLQRMNSLPPSSIENTLNWCMNAASTVHGRIESILRRRDCSTSGSRMISVNELITVLEINLPLIGVQLDELMLCQRGTETRLLHSRKGLLKYEAEFCFIGLKHLPMCMVPKKGEGSNSAPGSVAALVTANGHTVCAVCYVGRDSGGVDVEQNVQYALFDPMPGQMHVGLSAAQMGSGLQRMLSIPSCIVADGDVVVSAVDEELDSKGKKRNKMMRDGRGCAASEDRWEECGEGIQCIVQSKQGALEKRSLPVEEALFYGDVTLLHMNKVLR